jgi:hypothetical protein
MNQIYIVLILAILSFCQNRLFVESYIDNVLYSSRYLWIGQILLLKLTRYMNGSLKPIDFSMGEKVFHFYIILIRGTYLLG